MPHVNLRPQRAQMMMINFGLITNKGTYLVHFTEKGVLYIPGTTAKLRAQVGNVRSYRRKTKRSRHKLTQSPCPKSTTPRFHWFRPLGLLFAKQCTHRNTVGMRFGHRPAGRRRGKWSGFGRSSTYFEGSEFIISAELGD